MGTASKRIRMLRLLVPALLATLAEADTIVASSKAFELVRALLEKRPEGLWRPAKFKRGEIVRLAAGEEPGQTVVIAD